MNCEEGAESVKISSLKSIGMKIAIANMDYLEWNIILASVHTQMFHSCIWIHTFVALLPNQF